MTSPSSASSKCRVTVAPSARKSAARLITTLSRPGNGFFGSDSQVLRPITTRFPMVMVLKRFMSSAMRQGMAPALPITPLSAAARMRVIAMEPSLNHHGTTPTAPALSGRRKMWMMMKNSWLTAAALAALFASPALSQDRGRDQQPRERGQGHYERGAQPAQTPPAQPQQAPQQQARPQQGRDFGRDNGPRQNPPGNDR